MLPRHLLTAAATNYEKINVLILELTEEELSLMQGVTGLDSEADPFEMKTHAYILCGICKNGEEHQVKLLSMNTPITTLKTDFFAIKVN